VGLLLKKSVGDDLAKIKELVTGKTKIRLTCAGTAGNTPIGIVLSILIGCCSGKI
jgi:hypothetical protein